MPDDYVNAAEAARLLQQHEKTIRQWIHEGKIKGKKQGRDWHIPRTEIQRLQKAAQPIVTSDPLIALESRLRAYVKAELAALRTDLLARIEEVAARKASPARSEPQQTTLTAKPDQLSPPAITAAPKPPKRKAFTIDWRAWDWLVPHGVLLREMTDWHDIPLDTHAHILDYAKEKGHALHRCRDEACPCLDLLDD